MGATTSIPDSVNVGEIMAKTGLSRKKISTLWTRFYELDRDPNGEGKGYKGYLDVDDFSRIHKFDANPIASRLIKVIFDDFGTDGKVNFRQFVDFMSTFAQCERPGYQADRASTVTAAPTSTKSDLETTRYSTDDSAKKRKIKFIFHMYDVDHDGRLSKEDVQEILKMMVGKVNDDEASFIAEKVIAEFVVDQRTSTVSLDHFEELLKTLDFDDKMSLKFLK